MNNRQRTVQASVLLVLLLGTVFEAEASAYLDPGTGSMFIQGLIATIAAAAYAVRVYWSRIQSWIKRSDSRKGPAESHTVEPR